MGDMVSLLDLRRLVNMLGGPLVAQGIMLVGGFNVLYIGRDMNSF